MRMEWAGGAETVGNDTAYWLTYVASPDGSKAAFATLPQILRLSWSPRRYGTESSVTVLSPVSDYLGSAIAMVGWSPDGTR